MRGKPHRVPRHRGHGRNIPAYAGKTVFEAVLEYPEEEHPRVCGENTY